MLLTGLTQNLITQLQGIEILALEDGNGHRWKYLLYA
jgi:hypothetical protein